MALYERAELCKKLGITQAYLSMYIDREKVIMTGDHIDDSKECNAYFIKKRLDKLDKTTNASNEQGSNQQNTNSNSQTIEGKTTSLVNNNLKPSDKFDFDKRKEELTLLKMQEELELLRMKKDRQTGEVIPTPLVKSLMERHSKSITTSFQNGAEKWIKKVAAKKEMSRAEQTELLTALKEIINAGVDEAIAATGNDLENIIFEYSNKKEVGEKA